MPSTLLRTLNCQERIKTIRNQLGLTQEAFAEQLDISYSAYKKLESGENIPSVDTLYKFKTRFHVSADYLLFGESNSVNDIWNKFLNTTVQGQAELYYRILYYYTKLPKINFLSEQEQKDIADYVNKIFPSGSELS